LDAKLEASGIWGLGGGVCFGLKQKERKKTKKGLPSHLQNH